MEQELKLVVWYQALVVSGGDQMSQLYSLGEKPAVQKFGVASPRVEAQLIPQDFLPTGPESNTWLDVLKSDVSGDVLTNCDGGDPLPSLSERNKSG
jgi:hypothetical protein